MQEINGRSRLLGLIGCPVEHTLSPFIHNMFAELMNLNTVYVPLLVEQENLEEAIKGAKSLNFLGINVTIPYKTDVMEYLDEIHPFAKLIGAVNTIQYISGKAIGYNTDAEGLLKSCLREGIVIKDRHVFIIGAGGAAKATALISAREGARMITVINRTLEKAEEIVAAIKENFSVEAEGISYGELENRLPMKIDLCFQTTSVGMHPNILDTPILSNSFYQNIKWAVDLIYNPAETLFLAKVKENGGRTLNGLGMLFYQAVEAYELWNSCVIPEEVTEHCFKELMKTVYRT